MKEVPLKDVPKDTPIDSDNNIKENINIINQVDETPHLHDPDYYRPHVRTKYKKGFRFLVVSTLLPFAISDVWSGYTKALEVSGYNTIGIASHKLAGLMSVDVLWRYIHSMIMDYRNNFTHVIFIGGRDNTIPWLLKSIDKKSILITTEDPHGLDQSFDSQKNYDYYFTNERCVRDFVPNAKYLPTGACHYSCMPIKPEQLPDDIKSDVLFMGNVYPNRQHYLEAIIPVVKENNYKFLIAGITAFADKTSPLHDYVLKDMKNVIEHNLAICLYNASKIVININRDPFWESHAGSSNRRFNCPGKSPNPRLFEVGLCGKFQLVDSSRVDIFKHFKCDQGKDSELITYDSPEDLANKVKYYLEHEEERENIAYNFHETISKNHTYLNRIARLINFINLKENPEEGWKGLMKSAGKRK